VVLPFLFCFNFFHFKDLCNSIFSSFLYNCLPRIDFLKHSIFRFFIFLLFFQRWWWNFSFFAGFFRV